MSIATDPEVTQELRMPPAVAEWLAEQNTPPTQRPARPGCHRLGEWHELVRLPPGWPFMSVDLPALGTEDLYYDAFGVIRPVLASKFRRHAARHSAVAS